MRILLLNDNPVVNKLVTLSAQKTGDELLVVAELDEIDEGNYDLVIVDDAVYHTDVVSELRQKISFKRALFMGSRDTQLPEGFDTMLKKPFLPTDIVELFSSIAMESDESIPEFDESMLSEEAAVDDGTGDALDLEDTTEIFDMLDELDSLDEQTEEKAFSFEEESDAGMTDGKADEAALFDSEKALDDFDLADELEADDESVLDKEELEEVQALLEDTETQEPETIEEDSASVTLNEGTIDEVNAALEEFDFDEELSDLSEDDELLLEEADQAVEQNANEPDEGLSEAFEEELTGPALADVDKEDETSLPEEEVLSNIEGLELPDESGAMDEMGTLPDNIHEEIMASDTKGLNEDEVVSAEHAHEEIEETEVEEPHLSADIEEAPEREEVMPDMEELDFEESEEAVSETLQESVVDADEVPVESSISETDLENLEEQIESAVGELSEAELEEAVDEEILLDIVNAAEEDDAMYTGKFDELDALNEQDLKIAVGEADEEEFEAPEPQSDEAEGLQVSVGKSEYASLGSEALDEVIGRAPQGEVPEIAEVDSFVDDEPADKKQTHQEGIEALETLLKVLGNKDVAASLKGMNISINISFGDTD